MSAIDYLNYEIKDVFSLGSYRFEILRVGEGLVSLARLNVCCRSRGVPYRHCSQTKPFIYSIAFVRVDDDNHGGASDSKPMKH
jgi:hypothetical protein